MAQLILIGNTTATAALAVAEAGGTPVTVYFDDQDTSNGQSNNTAGVLEVGDILYTTYTPADPNTGTPESYTNPYDPTGGSAVWHFATDPSSNQLTVRVEGDAANTLGEVLNINTHSYDTLTSDVANVDEGGSVEFTVTTTNIPDGTTVLYSISGTGIDVNDFNPALNSLTGNITINSDTGSVTFILNEDVTTESAETLTLQLASADSNGVNTGALTHGVTINDTSLTVVNLPPLLDTPTAATASVTQNGQGNDSVTIDLSQHTQDPEQDPNGMTWKILTAPLTGSVRDTGGPTAGNNIPSFPHTLSGSNVIYRPDNTGAPSTTTFTWTAEDGSNTYPNGGQTADATATITINTPANTAPTGNAISLDLVANNSQNSTQFQRLATDDNTNSANLTFEWCLSQQQGGTTQNLAQINAALNHGQIAANSNVQGFTYTQNSGVNVNPGGNALEDIFYYKATDDDTTPLTSDPIQVQINNIGPVNNPPSWNPSNPGNTISIVAGTPYTVSAAATDQDGHTLIYTVTASNPSAINGTYNEVSQELTVTAQQAAGGSITIQATEDYPGGVSSSTTFQFSASATAERPLKFSTFSNSDTAVCNLTRSGNLSIPSGTKFYSTGQNGTDFIEDIAVGDFIYDDDDLQPTSVTKPTTNGYEWMSIEGFDSSGNLQVKAVKLNLTTGAIEQVLNCSVQSGAAWPIIVEYAENSNNFCAGQRPPIIDGEAWQNIADGATLTDVVANNGQLFSSEYYANQYTNNDSPTNYILASGIYLSLIHI